MTEDRFIIQHVTDPWKMRELEDVQVAAWGYVDREVLPASMFRIGAVTGAVVLGAYDAADPDGPAVGLAYGFPALGEGRVWHHSHLLAVAPEWRGSGAAVALKLAQRERALAQGLTRMTWTFDPLVARNARLNLGKLGARAVSYHPGWYALGEDRRAAFPADRLMIEWDLTAPHAERAARAYKDINRLAFKLLPPGGVLFTFSCSGGVGVELFHKIVASAALDAGVDGAILQRLGGACDHPMTTAFPEGEYLKGLVLLKR